MLSTEIEVTEEQMEQILKIIFERIKIEMESEENE